MCMEELVSFCLTTVMIANKIYTHIKTIVNFTTNSVPIKKCRYFTSEYLQHVFSEELRILFCL